MTQEDNFLNMDIHVAAVLQNPQAELRPGGDVDAAQWKEVASLPGMRGQLLDRASNLGLNLFTQACCGGAAQKLCSETA